MDLCRCQRTCHSFDLPGPWPRAARITRGDPRLAHRLRAVAGRSDQELPKETSMIGTMRQSAPSVSPVPQASMGGHVWAVVLAGGQGIRLRELTRHVYGDDRPKQYAVLTGGKS